MLPNIYIYIYMLWHTFIQNASGFLLQNVTVLLQNAPDIPNCDDFKLQHATVFTKCEVYYKLRQCKHPEAELLTKMSKYTSVAVLIRLCN